MGPGPAVAIVTDSASDLPADLAAARHITVVPLIVTFGEESFRAGIDLPMDAFYERLLAPDAPFPTTAACSPADFQAAFQSRFDEGAPAVVCITVGGKLSATLKSAQIARAALPEREIHVIDSDTAAGSLMILAELAAGAAEAGASAQEIVDLIERRKPDGRLYFVVDTLEYLHRGGRINAAQAAIGSVLSVKPIITIDDGVVETVDKPRTAGKARARLLELLTEKPVERLVVIHTEAPGVHAFAQELAGRLSIPMEQVETVLIGPSVAPHVGPGAYGAAVLVPHI
ncbi:MAG: fatty acid kinase fatty acid binding subunit [Chloroflexota bacterium]|nr:fatty acid kinase fatty acid binding subunit [Chloroflexota bacterium]